MIYIRKDLDDGLFVWQAGGRAVKHRRQPRYPYDDVIFATAATPDSTSPPHVDGLGAQTVTWLVATKTPNAYAKIWSFSRPKEQGRGIDSIFHIPREYDPSSANTKFYNIYNVGLKRWDMLYVFIL